MLIQEELLQKFRSELQGDEHSLSYSFPDRTHRAKQNYLFLMVWLVIRCMILLSILLVLFDRMLNPLYYDSTSFLPLAEVILGSAILVSIGIVVVRRRASASRLGRTLYAVTNYRLLVLTQDRGQWLVNSYYAHDLGQLNIVERRDAWGDIILGGGQRLTSRVSPRLVGIEQVRVFYIRLMNLKQSVAVLH